MNLQQKKDHLETLPGVLAVWWFIENVSDEDPDRQELFFYLRERVRRYSFAANVSDHYIKQPWRLVLKEDARLFEINAQD